MRNLIQDEGEQLEIEVILQNDPRAMMKNSVDEDDPDDSEILMRLCPTRTNVKVGTVHEKTDMEVSRAHKQIDLTQGGR